MFAKILIVLIYGIIYSQIFELASPTDRTSCLYICLINVCQHIEGVTRILAKEYINEQLLPTGHACGPHTRRLKCGCEVPC